MTTETTTEALEAVVSDVPAQPHTQPADLTRLSAELAKINATDTHLATLLGEARLLADMGLPDSNKEYDNLHRFVMTAQKVRTGALKIAKEMATPYKDMYDAIMGEAKRIGEKAKEAEDLTRPFKEQYERNLEQQKIDEQRARHERIVARMQSLMHLGMESTGGQYIGYGVTIDGIEVEALPDEEWNELFGRVGMAHAEQKRRDEEFAEQLRRDVEAEKKRQQDELKRQQDEADALKRQQDELLDGRLALRIDKLVGMGWQNKPAQKEVDAGDYGFFPYQILRNWSNAEFDEAISLYEASNKERTETIERIETRKAKLLGLGWAEYEADRFRFDGFNPAVTADLLGRISEEKFTLLVSNFKAWQIDEQQEREAALVREANAAKEAAAADKAKKRADKERTQRLSRDKAKLRKWVSSLDNITETNDITQPESIELSRVFVERVVELAQQFMSEIDAL